MENRNDEHDLLISVIIPIAKPTPYLEQTRQSLQETTIAIEVILVSVEEGIISPKYPFEKVVLAKRRGRGYACAKGINFATGEIILILHADTILPPGWDQHIIEALKNHKVVGGAFSLAFDKPHPYLSLLIFLSDMFFILNRELWGDRAMFIRAETIKDDALFMEVPIMEDVMLSAFIRKRGKVVKLKEKVTTSSDTFYRYGLLHHSFRIMRCRLWYALGADLDKIYNYYYSK